MLRIRAFALLLAAISFFQLYAKSVCDTVRTAGNDLIILNYNVVSDASGITVDFSQPPRIIPRDRLRGECKGEIDRLKVVVFDRIGDFGKVKWKGSVPSTFMVPSGLTHDTSRDGYFILGESQPIAFGVNEGATPSSVSLPLNIAVYEKKQTYRVITAGAGSLKVDVRPKAVKTSRTTAQPSERMETERIAIHTTEEIAADNSALTSALSSIALVNEMIESERELPFSMALQAEVANLVKLKNEVTDAEVVGRINDALLRFNAKERELRDAEHSAASAAKAEQQAMIEAEKAEAERQQREAEEKQRQQEEKQQKKTLWMIIGGVLLAILGFIGNAVFKHFRDVRNQRSIMEMQESLARQAQHEAGRRAQEIVRNKAHTMANKGRSKVRSAMQQKGKKPNDKNIRSI